MNETPRTDEHFSKWGVCGDYDIAARDFAETLERELTQTKHKLWAAETRLEERWGLRREINAALGITDETGDEALRKGLATINELKAQAKGG